MADTETTLRRIDNCTTEIKKDINEWVRDLKCKIVEMNNYERTNNDNVEKIKQKVKKTKDNYEALKDDMAKLREEFKSKDKQIENLSNEVKDKDKRLTTLEEQLKEKGKTIEGLQEQLQNSGEQNQIIESVFATKKKVEELESIINSINIGTTGMVANGILTLMVDTSKGVKVVYSPYFYSHANGYKLRLEVHPSGFGTGAETHLSAFIIICKGEYDAILPWPCKYTFSIGIINQINQEQYTKATLDYYSDPAEHKNSYNRPTEKDNPGNGFEKFIAHSNMSVRGVVVKNQVLIECVVTPPGINSTTCIKQK